jgi:hypothetical protein
MHEEIFGPVLSVYVVSTWAEAIEIENANPYGNAASVYTTVSWQLPCLRVTCVWARRAESPVRPPPAGCLHRLHVFVYVSACVCD